MEIEQYMRESDRLRKEQRERKKAGVEDGLKRAVMYHKENSDKGVVYLEMTDILDLEGTETRYVVKAKIAEFSGEFAVTADGRKISLSDVDSVALADEMDAEEIAVVEGKIEK